MNQFHEVRVSTIKTKKSKADPYRKSGVYKINCKNCPKMYIAQTGRQLNKRISEHHKAYENKKQH